MDYYQKHEDLLQKARTPPYQKHETRPPTYYQKHESLLQVFFL